MTTAQKPALLVLHADGAVSLEWWLSRLTKIAQILTIYRGDLIMSDDEVRMIESAGLAAAVEDHDEVDEVVARWQREHEIAGVVTFSELMLHTSARVAAMLGLPHHSIAATNAMQLKHLQRSQLAAAGVPVPAHALLRTDADVTDAVEKLRFPVVLKPVFSSGSAATSLVSAPEELAPRFREARDVYAGDWGLQGRSSDFIAEEFITGTVWHPDPRMSNIVSVESIVHDGDIHHLTVTDKFPQVPPFRETGDIMPSWLPEHRRTEILSCVTDAVRALGASHGALHTEVMLTADGPRIIEVNGRLGGYLARLLETAFEYDVVTQLGLVALGQQPEPLRWTGRYAADMNLMSPAEDVLLDGVDGVTQVERLPGVCVVEITPPRGIPAWRLGGGCYGYIEAVADEPAALLDLREAVLETVQVRTRRHVTR